MQGTPELYKEFADSFNQSGISADAFRSIKWGITKFLVNLVDACDGLLDQCYKLTSFIFSDNVQNYLSQYKAVLYILFAIALMLFGWQMMLVKKQDRSKIFQGLTISLMIIIGLPTLMSNVNTLSEYGIEFINSNYSTNARTVVQSCTTDLLYLDVNDFEVKSDEIKTSVPKKDIMNIDINSTVYSSDDGIRNGDVFKHYLDKDSSGKDVLKDIDDGGITSLNDNVYYRYTLDYTTIFFTLIASAIVILFTSFKCIQIIFDIIFNQFLATVLAATDWQTGQKMKETLKAIGGGFFTLFFVSLSLKFYMMFSSFFSSQVNSGIQKGIILIIGAIAVIHGPNLVEKILGIDAGLSSMFRTISTLYFGSRAVAGVAGAAGLAGGAIGAGGGLFKTLRNRDSNTQDSTNSISEEATKEGISDPNNTQIPAENNSPHENNNLSSNDDTIPSPSEGADKGNNHPQPSNQSTNSDAFESGASAYEGQDIDSISNEASTVRDGVMSNSPNSEGISDIRQESNHSSANTSQSSSESVSEGAAQMQRERHENSALGDAVSRSRGLAGRTVRGYREGRSVGEDIGNRINERLSNIERKRNLK